VVLQPSPGVTASLVIPRGQAFTGSGQGRNFTFVTDQNISVDRADDGSLIARDVLLFEGDFVFDSYVVNDSDPERYLITNKTVDTNSITVAVIEDNGENTFQYRRFDSLFGLDGQSPAFFIQPSENETYEIVFGDGVIGRRPKDRSVVVIQYRKCNGELPNGIRFFAPDSDISGATITNVITKEPARGGAIPESITSIKFNAPRSFATQERVVTASDYETLLRTNFSDINAVSAFGGEEFEPPQFGKVIIAVDLKTTDALPPSRIREFTNFIRPRAPLSIQPVFVDPEFTFVQVRSNVKYNINETSLNNDDIRAVVTSAIQNFNLINLNGFNRTLFYSNLVSEIDNSQISIVSNDTEIAAIKTFVPEPLVARNYDIDFGMSFVDDLSEIRAFRDETKRTTISSTPFFFAGEQCVLEDDGIGNMRIMASNVPSVPGRREIKEIGTVDYEKGIVKLVGFDPQSIVGNEIRIFAKTKEKDITAQRRTILAIRNQDIIVNVEQVRQ
jgi:hypothetical protein